MTAPVVAITGAGGGIGTALAQRFAAQGYRLAIADVATLDEVESTLDEMGVECLVSRVDVRKYDELSAWADAIQARFGRLDVLINNAGVTTWGTLSEQASEDMDWVLDVNIRGVTNGCHAFLPLLRRAERGQIVNIASMIGLFAMPLQTTYTASKWAVRGFSHALRAELRREGIGVTVVLPGLISTPFLAGARSRDAEQQAQVASLMKRFGTAPGLVAKRVFRAVRWNRGEIRVGWDSHLVAFLQRFLPGLLPLALRVIYGAFLTQKDPSAASE